MAIATRTDPSGAHSWRIHDKVDQFRIWADTVAYSLPADDDHEERWIIGSADDVWLQLHDESARISRRHAALTRDDAGWQLADLNSKNGLYLDGEKLAKFAIVPGAEIGIGRLNLLAESKLLRELQEILRRLLGWSEDRRGDVDTSLRSIRLAVTRHEPLVLCADDSHTAIARLLHSSIVGSHRPFIVYSRKGGSKSAGHKVRTAARSAAYEDGMAALAAAAGGTLVVRRNRLPHDFERVLAAVRAGGERVLLIVCVPTAARGTQIHSQIVVPPLGARGDELDRIVEAYAAEAGAKVGGTLSLKDREWVKSQPKLTISRIETGTVRALAYRAAQGEVMRAAELADVEHGSYSTWYARLPDLPAHEEVGDDDDDDD